MPAAIAAVVLVDRHRPDDRGDPVGRLAASGPRPTRRTSPSQLFSDWVLPFEIVGVLLLAAVIGGIFLAKRDRSATDDGE